MADYYSRFLVAVDLLNNSSPLFVRKKFRILSEEKENLCQHLITVLNNAWNRIGCFDVMTVQLCAK
jgi:hypothetical protein